MSNAGRECIGYRVGTVEIDLRRACVRVGGVETALTPLPLKLLTLLCEHAGSVCTRDQIFDAVWPRQEISDDALNKLISRVRELLGSEAPALVTVRKQGLRLDAAVERLLAPPVANVPASAAPPSAAPVAATPVLAVPPRSRPPYVWLAVGLLVLATLLTLVYAPRSGPAGDALVFSAYALRQSDLRSARPETAALLQSVEQAMDRSDMAQARRLLQSASASDPGCALLPALRAIHYGTDDSMTLPALIADARARLQPQDSPYARLMVDYAAAQLDGASAERPIVDALLTLRPEAWRLRLRRAHLDIQTGNDSGALRHLRAIPLDRPPPPTLMYVLADRASYGDQAAVRQALAAGSLAEAPLLRAYVEARLAWSTRAADTLSRLDTLAQRAEAEGVTQLANHALELAAALAYLQDDPQADARLRRAAFALRESGRADSASPLLALAAELAWRHQDPEGARALLQQAGDLAPPEVPQALVELEILNARLQLYPRGQFLATAGATDDRYGRGEPALVAGWHAYAAGRREQAAAALDEARASGIEQSPHRESAALLAVQLGQRNPGCWIDPPYPDLLRMAACHALQTAPEDTR
ncbi:MAG: winged helix-turn-helix domain-containing protein [Lysobacterales bacterium]